MRLYALIMTLWLAAGAAVAAANPPGDVLTDPDWIDKPSGSDLGANYPLIAAQIQIEGLTNLSCAVNDLGRLESCVVTRETPEGLGFGSASLAMSHIFRMRPQTRNGQPVSRGTVRIPIRFRLPETPSTSLPPSPNPNPSRVSLAYARRIAIATDAQERALEGAQGVIHDIEYTRQTGVFSETRDAAADALSAAVEKHRDALREALAMAVARSFTETDLKTLADFFESRGAPIVLVDRRQQTDMQLVASAWLRTVLSEAGKAFCATRPCAPSASELSALAAPSPEGVIDAPELASSPSDATLRTYGPLALASLGATGVARLDCKVGELGQMQACRVVMEAPAQSGYGAAALKAAPLFQLGSRQLALGAAGEHLTLRVRFGALPLPAAFEAPPARSETAYNLARRLATGGDLGERPKLSALLEGEDAEDIVSPAQSVASETIRTTVLRLLPALQDQTARSLAARFDEEQLGLAVAFRSTTVGRAFTDNPVLSDNTTALTAPLFKAIVRDARTQFCRDRDCGPPP